MTHTCTLMWNLLFSNFVPWIFAGARVFHRLSSDTYFSAGSSRIVDRIFYYLLSPASRRTVLHVRPTQEHLSFCHVSHEMTQRDRRFFNTDILNFLSSGTITVTTWRMLVFCRQPRAFNSVSVPTHLCHWHHPGPHGQKSVPHRRNLQRAKGIFRLCKSDVCWYNRGIILNVCVYYSLSAAQNVQLISLVLLQGMNTADEEGTYLGTLSYDESGTLFQTSKLPVSISFQT